MSPDWEKIRETEFPALSKAVYLKAAGGSPMCRSAYLSAKAYLDEMLRDGDLHYKRYMGELDDLRALIAEYVGASPDEIAFTVNASSGAIVAAEMLRRAGVETVFHPRLDFPATIHAIRNAGFRTVALGAPRGGAWIEKLGRKTPGQGVKGAKGGKSAVVGAHVCFLNGETLNIAKAAALCRRNKMLLAINATQSFGALRIDVRDGIDMMFASGLKWACAGYGSGFVFIRKTLIEEYGLPPLTGWLSVKDPYRMDPENTRPLPRVASLDTGGGFPPFAGLLALRGSLRLVKRIGGGDLRRGVRLIEERVLSLAERLRRGLLGAGLPVMGADGPAQSGIVSIRDARAPRFHKGLEKAGILAALRPDPEDGQPRVLRFAVHYYNNGRDLDAALSTMEAMV
ncbi:MAG: aminotransferase class V-fold PLP-dependent enzyme [Deltaproteobacteria bacterium]|nr:aminotransferase class V-fold PLP-dependent enzyme [Deltaproteobacteria bacterium]